MLQVGSTPTPVFVSHSHFGPTGRQLEGRIMVGPGFSIAPFRAFCRIAVASVRQVATGFFFGSDQKRDLLYEKKSGRLTSPKGSAHASRHRLLRDQLLAKVYDAGSHARKCCQVWAWLLGGG
jgi:sulfite reductase (NADPH) flavoprotein alpha-component